MLVVLSAYSGESRAHASASTGSSLSAYCDRGVILVLLETLTSPKMVMSTFVLLA